MFEIILDKITIGRQHTTFDTCQQVVIQNYSGDVSGTKLTQDACISRIVILIQFIEK